jgi:riboflavin kinase / FMN adenylyltransferase
VEGDVAQAAWLLGRPHALTGEVIHGAKRGRQLGYPTANLDIPPDMAIPAYGIYAVRCQLGDERLLGVASIGVRPTFDNGARSVEVYILDFDRDIYGQVLHAEFIARLRAEMKFPSVEALIEQMGRDVAEGRTILERAAPAGLTVL